MVELNEGFDEESAGDVEGRLRTPAESEAASRPPVTAEAQPAGASTAEGVRLAGDILRNATAARWPMYMRNVKQILRQAGGFDERRFGFTGLMDLLRALQRDGMLRLERDRRGGLRVFQGAALLRREAPTESIPIETGVVAEIDYEQQAETASPVDSLDALDRFDPLDVDAIEVQPGEVTVVQEGIADTEEPEIEPIPVDTTAELLGRAKPKRQTRGGAQARTRKPTGSTRKPPARRGARAKKAVAEAADSEK